MAAIVTNEPDWSKLPGVPFTFEFETNYNSDYHREWFTKNWTLSIPIAIGYIGFVYASTKYMKDRKPMNLRIPLALWSAILTIFSIYGCIRSLPELVDQLRTNGFEASICENR